MQSHHSSVSRSSCSLLLLAVGLGWAWFTGGRLIASEPEWRVLKSEFIYEAASFPSCHASTIAESRTGIVAAWFGGTHEKHPDVGIWLARYVDGHWTAPVEVADGSVGHSLAASPTGGTRYPTWNPVLFQPQARASDKEPPLYLFYKVGPSPETWWGMVMYSRDGGQSWSTPVRLPDGILGPIKNKPIELPNGDWLCPSSTESEEERSKWQVHFEWSSDAGQTWNRTDSINDGVTIEAIQPSLLRLGENRVLAIGRTRQDKIFQSESVDQGRTWSTMRLGSLPNNNSGLDAVTLREGGHLVVYNHVPGTPGEWGGKRTPLNLATSRDGLEWKPAIVLESTPGEFSYPAIIQSADGNIHITYTWNRKRIKHVTLSPRDK